MEPEELVALLASRKETVATAESLTAGLVCATLARVPGASAVIRGGLIVYATELKAELAGVDRALLAAHGAVHPEVAAQLAAGARTRCAWKPLRPRSRPPPRACVETRKMACGRHGG